MVFLIKKFRKLWSSRICNMGTSKW